MCIPAAWRKPRRPAFAPNSPRSAKAKQRPKCYVSVSLPLPPSLSLTFPSSLRFHSDPPSNRSFPIPAQNESRSLLFIQALGGDVRSPIASESADIASPNSARKASLRPKRLFRLSDASGQLMFDLVKNGVNVRRSDFGSEDVYIYDTGLQVSVACLVICCVASRYVWTASLAKILKRD